VLTLPGAALAQPGSPTGGDTVSWSPQQVTATGQGSKLKLILNGAVQPGWHVYGLKQENDGPTPLLVSVEANSVAAVDGAVTGSPVEKTHDRAFGLDTQFYSSNFSITVPIHLKPHLSAGPQPIPVSVRFQTCNGTVCQPPKTVHLSASVQLQAGG
jgi:hypothetical protein